MKTELKNDVRLFVAFCLTYFCTWRIHITASKCLRSFFKTETLVSLVDIRDMSLWKEQSMYQRSKKGLRHIFPEHTYTDGVRVEVNMLPSGKFPERCIKSTFTLYRILHEYGFEVQPNSFRYDLLLECLLNTTAPHPNTILSWRASGPLWRAFGVLWLWHLAGLAEIWAKQKNALPISASHLNALTRMCRMGPEARHSTVF